MIEFKVISNQKVIKRLPKEYPKLIEYEAEFSIIINGKVFFNDPKFPLLEFLHYVNKWKSQRTESLEYISIETEDNPLISFKSEQDMLLICSPWQLFKCETKFTKEEIVSALDILEKTVYQQIKHKTEKS